MLSLIDADEVSGVALDQGRQAMEHCINKLDDSMIKETRLHKWSFLQGKNDF